jgi:hypothetical protein
MPQSGGGNSRIAPAALPEIEKFDSITQIDPQTACGFDKRTLRIDSIVLGNSLLDRDANHFPTLPCHHPIELTFRHQIHPRHPKRRRNQPITSGRLRQRSINSPFSIGKANGLPLLVVPK